MNEKLQYASMLEIPVNTCTVTTKPIKKKRLKKKAVETEVIKEQLLEKINAETEQEELGKKETEFDMEVDEKVEENAVEIKQEEKEQFDVPSFSTASVTNGIKKRKRFKFSVIGVQFAIIGALALTILFTSAVFQNSGINVFFKNVFGNEQIEKVDERTFADFAPVIAMGDNSGIELLDGVISFDGEGSVYAPCDGVVSSIEKDAQGKFNIEITHSENFKTVISGIEYVYANLNDNVYHNIPVGYLLDDGASICFKNGNGTVLSNYQLVNNSVVWAV